MQDFFEQRPVFTRQEFEAHVSSGRERTKKAVEAMLAQHKKAGRIVGVRRQLYVCIPEGKSPEEVCADPFVLAASMADDAIVAYGAALDLHLGLGSPEGDLVPVTFLSNVRVRPTDYGRFQFRAVGFPVVLRDKRVEEWGVVDVQRPAYAAFNGSSPDCCRKTVRVTNPERTLVDLLDRPDLGGGMDVLWDKLPLLGTVDMDKVVEYTLLLGNATTAAKVGFYLDSHRERTGVEQAHLDVLVAERPRRPHYLERSLRRSGRLVKPWNLVAPKHLIV